jgi:peptidoglycan/LPS O-acetylase OafA/YrhL
MDYLSPWPSVLVMALVFGVAMTPLMRAADSPPIDTKQRVSTLDGLRGFLALGVYLGHAAIYHRYASTGLWGATGHSYFTLLGEEGVSLFFLITGFLFWSQLIAAAEKPDWIKLYVGRLFRIMPLYLVAVSVLLVEVFMHTGFHVAVNPVLLIGQIVAWSAGGISRSIPINGYADTGKLILVVWTLKYEWLFYLLLLPMSIFSRKLDRSLLFPLVVLFASLPVIAIKHEKLPIAGPVECMALFSAGMVTAALFARGWKATLSNRASSAIVLIILVTIFATFPDGLSVGPLALTMIAFYLIASGSTLFGLLSSKPARRLGNVSFGIYLLQGLVLAASMLIPGTKAFALSSPEAHWGLMGVDALVLVAAATVAHVLVERRGIDGGKRVASWATAKLKSMRSPTSRLLDAEGQLIEAGSVPPEKL